jgi:hypothetical protein
VTALKTAEGFEFTKGVHLTITGTALETSTQTIHSYIETVKFRMLPWTRDNFYALLANLKRSDEAEIHWNCRALSHSGKSHDERAVCIFSRELHAKSQINN